jgi:beta-N-acetylhexosaminidase
VLSRLWYPGAAVAVVLLTAACTSHPGAAPPSPGGNARGPSQLHSAAPSTSVGTYPTPSLSQGRAALTDERLVGQLFMAYVYGASATAATPAQRAANISLYGVPTGAQVIQRWHLGGVILIDHNNLDPARPDLSTGNVGTAEQVMALTAGLQRAALADSGVPLLIATDQEGGRVQRLTHGVDPRPSQLQLAHLSTQALTCSNFHLGQQLAALGINQDLAPVSDVVRTRTGVIGDRSFGPDPVLDGTDAAAADRGLQAAGVLATLKHWPGHGSTSTDSHAALAVIHESRQQWQNVDRAAFAAAAGNAGAIMVGHLALPAIDPSGTPATLSARLVNGELRTGLAYTGLTMTDSLFMQPMRAAGTPGEVAVAALRAGDDLLLESPDLPQAETAILAGMRHDKNLRNTVHAAVQRLFAAKQKRPSPAPHC